MPTTSLFSDERIISWRFMSSSMEFLMVGSWCFVYNLIKACDHMQINPHVASILLSHTKRQKYHVPRQELPSITALRLGASMASISAFAFQGTNAHVVLCRLAPFCPSKVQAANYWHRIRAW